MDEVDSSRGLSTKKGRRQQDEEETSEPAVLEQRLDERCRRAEAHLNLVEISKYHAQWGDKGMQLFRNTPSTLWDGAIDVVSPAKAADECNRISGQVLPPEEASAYEKDWLAAKSHELAAWTQFKVYSPMGPGKCNEAVVGNRWVLTWMMVERVKTVKARLAAKGYQDPDLKDGLVETSRCVSLRSSNLQVIALAALRGWRLWSLDGKSAFLQADGFGRDVFFLSPPAWLRGDSRRVWQLNAPACGLDDAPVAPHRSPKRFVVNERDSLKAVDLRLEASKFDPCLFFVRCRSGLAVGVINTHFDDLLGCDE